MTASRLSRRTQDAEWRAMQREMNSPEYKRRFEKGLAGRTIVQFVKDIRREMEAEDDRKRVTRPRRR